jgi:hypothetical protein
VKELYYKGELLMKKFIINISKVTLIIGGIIGTVVVTTLCGSMILNKNEYKEILMVGNQE